MTQNLRSRHPSLARAFGSPVEICAVGAAVPEIYEHLEVERYIYAIRLPANDVLQREIEPLLTRPVGRPSNRPVVWYHDFLYQADSWDRPRRVVAKIEHHKGELFPRVGFIVTNMRRSARGGPGHERIWEIPARRAFLPKLGATVGAG